MDILPLLADHQLNQGRDQFSEREGSSSFDEMLLASKIATEGSGLSTAPASDGARLDAMMPAHQEMAHSLTVVDQQPSAAGSNESASAVSTSLLVELESYALRSQASGKLSYRDSHHQAVGVKTPTGQADASSSFRNSELASLSRAVPSVESGAGTQELNGASRAMPGASESTRLTRAASAQARSADASYGASVEPLLRELKKRNLIVFESETSIEVYLRDYLSTKPELDRFLEQAKALLSNQSHRPMRIVVNGSQASLQKQQ